MTIKELLGNDIKDAMRAKDKNLLTALRLISAAIKQIEVDERIEVNDDRMLVILDKMSKQRKESIVQFKKANRDDLITQEEYELTVLAKYLPTPLTAEEIHQLIENALLTTEATRISDMGKVMAYLKPMIQGRADMAQISTAIKEKLSQECQD